METISIRQANVKDSLAIATIHVKTWQDAYRGQIPDSYLDGLSIADRERGWQKNLGSLAEGVYAIIAENDGVVVGWCTFGKSRDEDADSETGELHGIYVLPSTQGFGAGSKLHEHVLGKLKTEGYKRVTLWVLETNEKTRKWYESKGWQVEGKTKKEPREGFDLNEVRYVIDL